MDEDILFKNVARINVNDELADYIKRNGKKITDMLLEILSEDFNELEKQMYIGYAILRTALNIWEFAIINILQKTGGDLLTFYHNKHLMDIVSNKLVMDACLVRRAREH